MFLSLKKKLLISSGEANKTRVQRSLADMPPSTRWYHEHKATYAEKHRAQSREYRAKHREYYIQKSREYYLKNKQRLASGEKPKIKPGLPERLPYEGIMLLLAAVVDQARKDVKAYEKRLKSPPKKKKRLSGDKVSYKDYLSAVSFLENEVPEWERIYSFRF